MLYFGFIQSNKKSSVNIQKVQKLKNKKRSGSYAYKK